MDEAYTVLWTQDTCRALRRSGREGLCPPVAFSGIHSSLPSWRMTDIGDEVYALHVGRGVLHVVCRLTVTSKDRHDCCGPIPVNYGAAFPGHADWAMLGAEGCSASVVHVDASPVRFDLPIPADMLVAMKWRNRRNASRGLKHIVDGRLVRSTSLQGGVYRLTEQTAADLDDLLASAVATTS